MKYIILIILVVFAISKISKKQKSSSQFNKPRKKNLASKSTDKATIESESDFSDYNQNKWKTYVDSSMSGWIEQERSNARSGVLESLIDFETYKEYMLEFSERHNLYDQEGTTKSLKAYRIESKKSIDEWLDELHRQKYNDLTKEFVEPFDITGYFLQIRAFMTNENIKPIKAVYWNLEGQAVSPFYGLYNFCLKYCKYKKSSKLFGELFENVVKWEKGEILRQGEPGKQYEEQGLWINWNRITKDFVSPSIRKIIKKDNSNSKYNEDWILGDVPKYINQRADFYNRNFISRSKYFVTDKTISLLR